jgi:hypothetical protein
LLPFDPTVERLVWVNRLRENGPVVYVTTARVYLLKDNAFVADENVDAASFQLIAKPAFDYSANYSRDKNSVYYYSAIDNKELVAITGADPQTFQQVKDDYGKDKTQAYHKSKVDTAGPIVQLEPEKKDKVPYSKNGTAVFYYGMEINGADAKTFSILGHGFSRDIKNIFYEDQLIPNVDPETFIDLSDNSLSPPYAQYIKDKMAAYYCTHFNGAFIRVDGGDVASFQGLQAGFAVDRKHVFYKGKVLSNVENDGFKVLYKEFPMGLYVQSARHVYIVDGDIVRAIDKAEAQSFSAYGAEKVRSTDYDAEDKNYFFKDGQIAKKK